MTAAILKRLGHSGEAVVRERLGQFFRRYSRSAAGLLVVLAILSSFMWWWSQSGFKEDEVGTKVIGAFSSLALALAALWAGQGLKRRQEEAAHARAELALNVELTTRVIPYDGQIALEAEVRVKNVSNKTWNLPLVYVFVHPVITSVATKGAAAVEVAAPGIWKLEGKNIARFANTMTRLSPDEEEIFSAAYLLDAVGSKPYYLVLVEAVAFPDSREFDEDARYKFDDFMDGKINKRGEIDSKMPAEKRPLRDTYMVIETTEKSLVKSGKYAKRVLIVPRSRRKGDEQVDRIDPLSECNEFKRMLAKSMMWSRKRIVCVRRAESEP